MKNNQTPGFVEKVLILKIELVTYLNNGAKNIVVVK